MSNLWAECNRCGKQMRFEGMGNVTHVTIERFTMSRRDVDRRYLCPNCADALLVFFEELKQMDEEDIPMGG